MSFCHLLQGGSQKTNLVTSVSKIIVPYNFPCRCHNCQSELRINIFMLSSHLLAVTSEVLSFRPFLSNSSPSVHLSLGSDFQSLDWVAAGRQPLRPHMWLDCSHRASTDYCGFNWLLSRQRWYIAVPCLSVDRILRYKEPIVNTKII